MVENEAGYKVKVLGYEEEGYSISNKWATLEYYFDPEYNEWVIEGVESWKKGEGKKVVREFVRLVGTAQKVKVQAIIEEQSRKRLKDLGILDFSEKNKQHLRINTPALFKTMKMARVLEGGGLKIDYISIEPPEKEYEKQYDDSKLPNETVNVNIMCHT